MASSWVYHFQAGAGRLSALGHQVLIFTIRMIRVLRSLPKQGDDPVSPFLAEGEDRPFRLLVDRTSVTDDEAFEALGALAAVPGIECWFTTDDGERWVEIDWATELNDHIAVWLHSPGRLINAALTPASTWRMFAERISTTALPTREALRQLGYAAVGSEHRFDMLVSDSRNLLREPFKVGDRINIRSTKEAVAHLALFLRSRGVFALGDDRASVQGRFWFYLVASRAVLPAADRWFSGCQVSTGVGEDALAADALPATLRALGQTCLERVEWAVRARDRVLSVVAADLIPFYLDMFLLQLSGAFDALAQVTAQALGVHVQRGSPSWRTKEWLKELAISHPALAAVMAPGSPHRDVLEIISLLRNSIHESGLPPIGMANSVHGPTRTTVRTPRGSYAAPLFKEAVDRLGGAEAWGVQTLTPGTTTIDPLAFIDRALVRSLSALNALMAATPVEAFPNVGPVRLRDGSWSGNGPSDPWSEWTRRRVLLLLGLRDDVEGF